MARLRFDNLWASLAVPLDAVSTTLHIAQELAFADGQAVPSFAAPDHLLLVIDPDKPGLFEVVDVVAYTQYAQTLQVTRAYEGIAKSHSAGAVIIDAPLASDLDLLDAQQASQGSTLAAETTRATAAETANAEAISAETTRAETAEALAEQQSHKGAANGYAPLDSSSKVPAANMPALAINDTFTVASQAAMLALTAQRGDVAVRSDISRTFILATDDPTQLSNWVQLSDPQGLVESVNGQTGAVTIPSDPAAATPGLRSLGTGAQQAAAGNDARFSDQRTPLDNSVTSAKIVDGAIVDADVNATAAIAESKLSLASDAVAGTASRRTLGTGAQQAAAGTDARLSDTRVPTDGSVTDAKVSASAAIAKAKLAPLAIVDADVNAISSTKISGLGTAATHPATDFDAAGASAAETTRATAAEAVLTTGLTVRPAYVTPLTAAAINAAITAVGAGGGLVPLAPGTYVVDTPVVPTSGIKATGTRGATILQASAGLTDHMLKNSDQAGGNRDIELTGLTFDGNSSGRAAASLDNVNLCRVTNDRVVDVESHHALRHGLVVTGNTVITRRHWLTDLSLHDNVVGGLWVSAAAREAHIKGVSCDGNGTVGADLDASEMLVEGLYADANTLHGIIVSNVFGCTFIGFKATRNGGHGIIAWAIHSTLAQNWLSIHNSVGHANTYDDINVAVTSLPGFTGSPYGTTEGFTLVGAVLGYDATYGDSAVERWPLYVEDGIGGNGPVNLVDVTVLTAGQSGTIRRPTNTPRLLIREAAA